MNSLAFTLFSAKLNFAYILKGCMIMQKVGITTVNYNSELGFYSNGVNKQYQEKIFLAGGLPFLIPLHEGMNTDKLSELAEHYANEMDSLLLVGGSDVTPNRYSKQINQDCGDFDTDRDIWEVLLIQKFISKSKPIMGICRGFQLLNVELGGSLVQHMESDKYAKHWHNINRTHQKTHKVNIYGDSLRKLFGDMVMVNSFHHQCIDQLAEPFKSSKEYGKSSDDVIEIVFNKNQKILGVQWHPEMLRDEDESDALFRMFLSLADE